MEMKVNKVMKLENGENYVILKHAIYKEENYYIAAKLDKNNNPLHDELKFYHQLLFNDKLKVEEVNNIELIKYLYSYMQF